MRNIRLIAVYEYVRHVRRRSFLLTALGIPFLLAALFGIIFLVARQTEAQQIGVIDQTGQLITPAALSTKTMGVYELYPDEMAARAALDAEVIDAYVVIPSDYLATGDVRAVANGRLSNVTRSELSNLLRQGLLSNVPAAQRERIATPADVVLRTLEGGREFGGEQGVLLFVLPYGLALVFVITTFTTSGYLLQAITEEKEGRVIELMATSVSPTQMMAGKILGLSGVGFTQMLIWIAVAVVGVLLALGNVPWLADLQLPWSILGMAWLYFVLGYLLIAACYAMLGAAVTNPQEAQPLVAPISLIAMAPLFLLLPILAQPNGTIATVLSLIPFSAPMTMLMRLPLADIPVWQTLLSLALLLITTVGAMWLAARVMRIGMLRYGKRLSLREMFGVAS